MDDSPLDVGAGAEATGENSFLAFIVVAAAAGDQQSAEGAILFGLRRASNRLLDGGGRCLEGYGGGHQWSPITHRGETKKEQQNHHQPTLHDAVRIQEI
jgi:hypothetical protein